MILQLGKRAFQGDDNGVLMAKMMAGMQICKMGGGRGVLLRAMPLCYCDIESPRLACWGREGQFLEEFSLFANGCFEWIDW